MHASDRARHTYHTLHIYLGLSVHEHQNITHGDGHDLPLNPYVLCLKQPCSNSQCDEVYIWVHDISTLTLIHTREASQTSDDMYSQCFTIADNAPARHSEHTRVIGVRARESRRANARQVHVCV